MRGSIVAGTILAGLLLCVGCSDTSQDNDTGAPDAASDLAPDRAPLPIDAGLPGDYKLWPCSEPGKACNAHDPCAINPICGPDNKCYPTTLMDCRDKLDCTDDICAGAGLCKNPPKSGWCVLGVTQGSTPDGGVPKTEFKCFTKGSRSPDDPCKACNPTEHDGGVTNNTTWMPVNGGRCDDKNLCTRDDTCVSGVCKGTNFASLCADGFACTDDICDGKGGCLGNKLKSDWCLISGTCYKQNTAHPSGTCYTCDPSRSQSQWTPITNTCTIGGKCYNKGAKHSGGCAVCDPTTSTSKWTVNVTTHCLISDRCVTAGTKDSIGCASCQPSVNKYGYTALSGMCKIDGKCYAKGAKNSGGCAECDPTTSSTSWTVTGTTHCLINNVCVASGTKDPTPGSCSSCQPTKNKYGYSADAGYCLINNVCIKDGTAHPQGCATCDVSKSRSSWTPKTAQDCLIAYQCAKVCSGTCVDIQTNASHCGKCDNKCTSPLVCAGGKCTNYVPGSKTFNYTGAVQTWIVPGYANNSIKIEAWGAQGGADSGVAGGKGGYAYGTLKVTSGTTLYIYVGGQGKSDQSCNAAGGFNGGGSTGTTCCSNAGALCGSGGGASDVRVGGTALTNRVIVGAGGGGSGSSQPGANGGGLVGSNGGAYSGVASTGGTQTAGGKPGGHYTSHTCSAGTAGTFGQGGTGDGNDGGGGGGGWYGGGGGSNNYGGAGGSSYYGGMTSGTGTTAGARTGNGQVKISW